MDRSFLSQRAVVEASRRFVCVRLLTYESAEEAPVLTSIFTGRSGQLENTTFALLAPDGKTKLARAGRSPDFAFRGGPGESAADEMASAMTEIAQRHENSDSHLLDPAELPLTRNVRLGLDVASCDGLPLVVVTGGDAAGRAALVKRLAPFAWSAPFLGRLVFAVADSDADLVSIEGRTGDAKPSDGRPAEGRTSDAASSPRVLVVEPDTYGLSGKVLSHAAGPAGDAALRKALVEGLRLHRAVPKDARTHIGLGERLGIRWEPEIPVTDPGPGRGGPPPGGAGR